MVVSVTGICFSCLSTAKLKAVLYLFLRMTDEVHCTCNVFGVADGFDSVLQPSHMDSIVVLRSHSTRMLYMVGMW